MKITDIIMGWKKYKVLLYKKFFWGILGTNWNYFKEYWKKKTKTILEEQDTKKISSKVQEISTSAAIKQGKPLPQ